MESSLALVVLAVVLGIWFLSSKQTRKSFGASAQEVAKISQQSLVIARASALKEAQDELEDISALLKSSDELLGGN